MRFQELKKEKKNLFYFKLYYYLITTTEGLNKTTKKKHILQKQVHTSNASHTHAHHNHY